MNTSIQKIIIALIVLLTLFVVYYVTMQSKHVETTEENGFELLQKSEQILADTKRLNTIQIDPTIFDGQDFASLVDTRVPIPDMATGRENPFAPTEE